MSSQLNLTLYIKSGHSVLYLCTPEESRAEVEVFKVAKEVGYKIKVWSHTQGFEVPGAEEGEEEREQIFDPVEALTKVQTMEPKTIVVMRDIHAFFQSPKVTRQIRDISRDFKQQRKCLIIISAVKKISPEFERDITVLEFELPKREDIERTLKNTYNKSIEKKLGSLAADEQDRIISAGMGLTVTEFENSFAKAIIEFGGGDQKIPMSKMVMAEKAITVKKTGILEYFEAKQTSSDIGGLENLKEWLTLRSKAFSKEARDFGLPMPRGILLAGLPGCGKSLSAKAASNILGVPLLRFDIGKVFGGLVGESERNMRTAIQTSESIGASVLWIDEMEKCFAGMGSGGSTDGGTSQRVFGSFITWMSEKTTPCFIIATVNKIEGLPPELLRKGRFDETFFVGLPSDKEREVIVKIHLKKYAKDHNISDYEIADCVSHSSGFSGAEIEEAVVSGMYTAFNHGRKLLGTDVLKAIKITNPLSKTKSVELTEMAKWAESNAINASKVDVKSKSLTTAGRQLDI